jgi:hypothetical protein
VGLDVATCAFGKDGLGDVAAVQDRSRRGGPQDRNTLRRKPRDLPRPRYASVAGTGGHCGGAGIPLRQLAWKVRKFGPVRRSCIDVARVVKKLAQRAGLDAAKYAGHSLLAGHATATAIAGASERSIMNPTGHRPVQIVRRYIRDGS